MALSEESLTAAVGARQIDDVKAKIAHELSDCLWSVLVLGTKLDDDLGVAFSTTMNELEQHLTATSHARRAGGLVSPVRAAPRSPCSATQI